MPLNRRLCGTALLATVALLVLFLIGRWSALPAVVVAEPPPAASDLAALQLQRAQLDAEVAEQALELLRIDLVTLRSELEAANEELALYRQMLGVESLPEGLSVSEFAVWPLPQAGSFGYRWVLMQNNKQRESLVVKSRLSVSGTVAGEPRTLGFGELGDVEEVALRVRYFTIARGTVQLPAGFEPDQLHVQLRYSWLKQPQYEASFAWQQLLQQQAVAEPSAISD